MATLDNSAAVTIAASDDAWLHVRPEGPLSWDSHAKLAEALDMEMGFEWRNRSLILDLHGVTFIDSSGISSLLTLVRELEQHGSRLILCSVPPLIDKTFRLVRLSKMIPITNDASAARAIIEG